nr:aminopeptidase N C-terminal domain-containing protein [Akkermansiaceae bacterium]
FMQNAMTNPNRLRALVGTFATANPTQFNRNNDIFWSDMAVRYVPEFRVATLEEGLSFAFEVSPTTCLEMNGGKMPFGCHAWGRYDKSFWEPYLVSAPSTASDRKAS